MVSTHLPKSWKRLQVTVEIGRLHLLDSSWVKWRSIVNWTRTASSCRSEGVHAESARIRLDSIRNAHRVPKAIFLQKLGLHKVYDSRRGQMFRPLFWKLQGLCSAWRLCTFGPRLDSQPRLSLNAPSLASRWAIWRFINNNPPVS